MSQRTRVKQILFDDVINFAIQSQINNLAPGTLGTDAVNKNQLDAVATLINNLEWLNSVDIRTGLGELNPQPYWGFDDLFHKAGTKLLNCFYIQADVKKLDGEEYFYYSRT